jgi:hypothetical protein
MKFRKLMLLHRLVHYQDSILDLDIGLEGRDKELCKPLQQLFRDGNGNIETEIVNALDQFLNKKRQGKKNLFEVALLPILARLISTHGVEFRASLVWNEIIQTLEGTYDNLKQPNDFHTADFGTLYRNNITTLICDKFGADKRHGKKGSILTFDLNRFARICKTYGLDEDEYILDIQTRLNPGDRDDNSSTEPSHPSPRHPQDQEFPPKCYHCNANGFSTKYLYEEHGVRAHPKLPLYPGPADLESLGLIAQGMPWEQHLPRDQYFEFELESKK